MFLALRLLAILLQHGFVPASPTTPRHTAPASARLAAGPPGGCPLRGLGPPLSSHLAKQRSCSRIGTPPEG